MTKSFDDIVQVVENRRAANSDLINEMLEVRKRYHADYIIPMPDLDDQPDLPPLTPALVANAIDAPALDAGQVLPDVFCPPIDFTKHTGVKSREYARKREHAVKSTWYASKMRLQLYRMFRHMCGYASATILTRPNYKLGMPYIEIRDPLSAYPEPKDAKDLDRVANIGFIHGRSATWLRNRFPAAAEENGGPIPRIERTDIEMWDMIEWWDDDQLVWGILGPQYPRNGRYQGNLNVAARHFHLKTFRNKIGRCPAVTMPRITLDRIATQVAHNTGIIDFMGRLLMLDMIAAERNVFPDRYIVGERNEMPRITSNAGNWADGRTGQTNMLEGVSQIGELKSQPDPMTRAAYDTLERNYKVSTGMSGLTMGENTSNLRTGRAISEIYGVSVDPRVMELQRIAEHGLAEMNEDILATWESCWPDDKVTLFAGFAGNRSVDEIRPAKHIEGEHRNAVTYTIAGADVQQTTIALGQLYGTDAISLDTMRRKHPYIDDAEVEKRLVDGERIERAMFDTVLAKAQNGELPLTYLARVSRGIIDGKTIDEAVEEADEKLREEQATAPEAPPEGMGAPPEAMPGLEAAAPAGEQVAALGAGPGPQPGGPPIGPTDGQVGLDQLMSAMRGAGAGPG